MLIRKIRKFLKRLLQKLMPDCPDSSCATGPNAVVAPPLEGDIEGACCYYTRSEIDAFLALKADLEGGLLKLDQLLASTESDIGSVRLATEAEVDAADVASGDAVVRAQHLQMKTDANGATSVGDLGGDARGQDAVNLQTGRAVSTQVASGASSVVVGPSSEASGGTAVALGHAASALGTASTALGNDSRATETNSVAIGNIATASSPDSTAIGFRVVTNTTQTTEIGTFSALYDRLSGVRIHGGTGMVGFTIQDRAAAYADGGATAGSEADNTLMRGGYSIRRDGDDIYVDLNIAGTIKTLPLGTAT
jgi:hypothetical protein